MSRVRQRERSVTQQPHVATTDPRRPLESIYLREDGYRDKRLGEYPATMGGSHDQMATL